MEDEKIQYEASAILESVGVCKILHILPQPGGLHDQDSLYVHYMIRTLKFQQEREELDQHKANQRSSGRRRK